MNAKHQPIRIDSIESIEVRTPLSSFDSISIDCGSIISGSINENAMVKGFRIFLFAFKRIKNNIGSEK
jgi:hypothetical protein